MGVNKRTWPANGITAWAAWKNCQLLLFEDWMEGIVPTIRDQNNPAALH
jgi:hypothetical protein